MEVICFVNSVFQSNTFLLKKHSESSVYLVDCGDTSPVIDYIHQYHLSLKGIFLTHTHFDHIYGLNELLRLYSELPVYTSSFGMDGLVSDKLNLSRYNLNPFIFQYLQNVVVLENGSRIQLWKDRELEVMATPGHDKSCLTFRIENALFTGDSYIPGLKVLATFPNSDKVEAEKSRERILKLAKVCKFYPGHGK